MSQWDFSGPPSGQGGEYDEYGEFVHSDDFEGGAFKPISYEREPYPVDTQGWPYDRQQDGEEPRNDTAVLRTWSGEPEPPWAPQAPQAPRPSRAPRTPWPDESWPPRVPSRSLRPRRPRWLIPGAVVAAVAAATGVGVVLLANGQPASHPSGGRLERPGRHPDGRAKRERACACACFRGRRPAGDDGAGPADPRRLHDRQ